MRSDGKQIAYSDKHEDLWILDIDSGDQKKISENQEGIGPMTWSPNSRWLAYAMKGVNSYARLYLYVGAVRNRGGRLPTWRQRVNDRHVEVTERGH